MKVNQLIKNLETFDGSLEVKCVLPNGDAYNIDNFDIGRYVQGIKIRPFCKIIISDWDSVVE